MPAGRADSIFSWADLRRGGNTTKIAAWVRLLSSVGVNAIAPQDVNWDQRNNYLDHLDEVAALGPLLRKYAIRLFWTPNFLLAPNRSTADALFKAVPDFGGYLYTDVDTRCQPFFFPRRFSAILIPTRADFVPTIVGR